MPRSENISTMSVRLRHLTVAAAIVLLTACSGRRTATAGPATATFADAEVGTGKIVTASGLTLTGVAAGNYVLTTTTATTTASITDVGAIDSPNALRSSRTRDRRQDSRESVQRWPCRLPTPTRTDADEDPLTWNAQNCIATPDLPQLDQQAMQRLVAIRLVSLPPGFQSVLRRGSSLARPRQPARSK